MPLTRVIGAAAALTLAQASAPDTAVTGARLSIATKPATKVEIVIENRRDVPLVEWQVGSGWAISGGRGSIAPHARETVEILPSTAPGGPPARIIIAAFADGWLEGVGPQFQTWLDARRAHSDDLGYWVRAFMAMPRVSLADLRKYLADKVAERVVDDRPNVSHVSDRVRDVLRRYPDGPDMWQPLDRLKAQIEAEYLEASRESAAGHPGAVEAVTGAAVVLTRETDTTSYAVVIENLREVPIEAIGFDEVDASGRRREGRSIDYCVSDPASHDHRGRIEAHERREFPLYGRTDPPGEYRLSFVMFDDLTFEGSASARADLLQRRDERAGEFAFVVDALRQAATKPASDVEAFLLSRKVERARQRQEEGKPPVSGSPIDEMLRRVRESPARFLAGVDGYRQDLEQVLARLRRHR